MVKPGIITCNVSNNLFVFYDNFWSLSISFIMLYQYYCHVKYSYTYNTPYLTIYYIIINYNTKNSVQYASITIYGIHIYLFLSVWFFSFNIHILPYM